MLTVLLAPLVATASVPPAQPRCITIIKPAMVPPFGESGAAADQADVVSLILDRAAGTQTAAIELRMPAGITTPPCAAGIRTGLPKAAQARG